MAISYDGGPIRALCVAALFLCLTLNFFGLNYAQRYEGETEYSGHSQPSHGRCEKITVALCKDIQYNETILPNLLKHQKQEEAGMEVHQFYPLVKTGCSKQLKFFLCTMYFPVCTVMEFAVPPCKDLCLEAKEGCEKLMNTFGFPWPAAFDCDKFPTSEDGLCVGENKNKSKHGGTTRRPPTHSGGGNNNNNNNHGFGGFFPNAGDGQLDLGINNIDQGWNTFIDPGIDLHLFRPILHANVLFSENTPPQVKKKKRTQRTQQRQDVRPRTTKLIHSLLHSRDTFQLLN